MKKTVTTPKVLIYIYLLLWCIYNIQGFIFSTASLMSKLILVVLLLVSLYYFVKANASYKLPKVLKVLSIIVVVFSIYGLIRILINESILVVEGNYMIKSWDYLKNIWMSFLPAYVFYVVVKNDNFSESDLRIWTIVFLTISIVSFYWHQNETMIAAQSRYRRVDEVTTNAAYEVLPIIIMLPFFSKRSLLQYAILSVCLYHLLIGMKRGALLCGLVATIWFFYVSFHNTKNLKRKVFIPLLIVLVCIGAMIVFNSLLQNSDWFNTRMEKTMEGDSSNRDLLYGVFWNHFINESNPFIFLFGNGADATSKIFMNFAHNDWLEIAINNGAIMLVLYFLYWVTMFRTARKAKGNMVCFMVLNLYFIIYFMKSWFSMSYGDIEIGASVALGYALANSENSLINTNIKQQ